VGDPGAKVFEARDLVVTQTERLERRASGEGRRDVRETDVADVALLQIELGEGGGPGDDGGDPDAAVVAKGVAGEVETRDTAVALETLRETPDVHDEEAAVADCEGLEGRVGAQGR